MLLILNPPTNCDFWSRVLNFRVGKIQNKLFYRKTTDLLTLNTEIYQLRIFFFFFSLILPFSSISNLLTLLMEIEMQVEETSFCAVPVSFLSLYKILR